MKLGFIGFGNMAQAMAAGFVASGAVAPAQIVACARDVQKLQRTTAAKGYTAVADAATLVTQADVIVVAVKPYQVEAVLAPLRGLLCEKNDKIVISVAAGWTLERYAELFAGDDKDAVRLGDIDFSGRHPRICWSVPESLHLLCAVPNTPVAVCEGIVVCERAHSLGEQGWMQTERLLSHLGLVIRVDTPLLGLTGTVCGCGPAFVAMFIEALADAAVKHGLARADAYRMVSQMVAGTGKLQLATGQHPGAMKDAVCSPGGTTIVGVAELERKGFRGAVIDAVDKIMEK